SLLTHHLAQAAPELHSLLTWSADVAPAARFAVAEVRCETQFVPMRDGVKLATDVYLPPVVPAPAIVLRTPYDRAADRYVSAFVALVRRGYVVIAQDCRGTGDSGPECWDYYVYESEDGVDL